MKAALTRRLQALEAMPAKRDTEADAQLTAAFQALFRSVSHYGPWAPSKAPPHYHEERPSDVALLWERIQSGTTTDADRELLASLPPCRLSPEELVGTAVSAMNKLLG